MSTIKWVLAGAVALSAGVPASAQVLAPARASDLVALIPSGDTSVPECQGWYAYDTRVLSNGTYERFRIPPGRVFVLTGALFDIGGVTPERIVRPCVGAGANLGSCFPVMADAGGRAAGVFTVPPVALSSSTPLCGDRQIVVYGFLAADE